MLVSAPVSERIPVYADVPEAQWSDWRWQQRHRVVGLEELSRIISLTDAESRAFEACVARFRFAVTPYYVSLIDPDDPFCPIRRQAIPSPDELHVRQAELSDPLAEERHMPVPGLTHRYPDRVLLYATHNCAMYCRFCTRKRKVGDPGSAQSKPELGAALDYIRRTPQVRDVIVSGGDPLSLSNERLDAILGALSEIDHVEVARLGTRNLVTLPQRVDAGLCAVLRRRQSRRLAVFVMTHFNHPRECTAEAWAACDAIASTGTPIQNQMVLLRGVNDGPAAAAELNHRLLRMRVKPYYIIHADMAEGIGHFRTSVRVGMGLLDALRGHTSGLAVPQYVVDLPGGGGKVPVIPEYVVAEQAGGWTFRNYSNDRYELAE